MDVIILLWIGLSILLAIAYAGIMYWYLTCWSQLPIFNFTPKKEYSTSVSILVPARNEEQNIDLLLESFLAQSYPKGLFEVLIIDDFSTDNTAQIVNRYNAKNANIQLLQLSDFIQEKDIQSFKKKALEIAIQQAKGELIITTDADCTMGKNWLSIMVDFYKKKQPKFIAAPVNFHQEQAIFEKFQSLDFIGMMGVTGAGIHGEFQNMCNGANMAYPKSIFEEVGGYTNVDQHASGDDMFLMHKIAQVYPRQIAFLKNKEATVYTTAKKTLKGFVAQRLRWATKNASYQDWQITLRLGIVFLFLVTCVINFFLAIFLGISLWIVLGVQVGIKAIADYFFLGNMTTFFDRKELMKTFLPSLFLHIFYIVGIGFASIFIKKYTWKGRQVK